jgi:hypothetical protein
MKMRTRCPFHRFLSRTISKNDASFEPVKRLSDNSFERGLKEFRAAAHECLQFVVQKHNIAAQVATSDSAKEAYMTELSHFEQESTKTPTKVPYAIIGGTLLLIILLYILNQLAPNEAIEKSRQAQEEAAATAAPSAAADDDEI